MNHEAADVPADPVVERPNWFISQVLLLLVRSLLLWIVIPLAVLVWPLLVPRLERMGVGFRQYLGWVDFNLIVFLQRVVFRPLMRQRDNYVSLESIATIAHRVRFTDPF